jgi:metallophosphoesterase superfamily enzyme
LELPGAETNALPAVLAPYLQHPASDAMTVCLPAQGAADVRVVWRAESGSEESVVPAAGLEVPGTPWTVWRARLSELTAGAAVRYEVLYSIGGAATSSAPRVFRLPDPAAASVRFAVFNDLHNRDATLAALLRHVKTEDYEFALLNGDCWNDPSGADGAREVFRVLDAYVRLLDGSSKPILLVRGNHETRGNFAGRLARLFDLPRLDPELPHDEQRWAFTLRAGPAFLLAMDTGEDDGPDTPADSYKRPAFWQGYRLAEARWLGALVAADPAAGAAWRLFVSHIPLYNSTPWFCESAQQAWEPHLHAYRPHAMLAGHDHDWKTLEAGRGYSVRRKRVGAEETLTVTPPWPVFIGGGPSVKEATVLLAEADASALRIRVLAAQDGRALADFTARAER